MLTSCSIAIAILLDFKLKPTVLLGCAQPTGIVSRL